MRDDDIYDNLSGKFLIASPYLQLGDLFKKSVIYVLSQTKNGSIGLIVNNLVNNLPFKTLFKNNPNIIPGSLGEAAMPVFIGGQMEPERGFFLHSLDYDKNLLFKFQDELAVSSNTEILADIVAGTGPKESLFLIGYTGWGAGQLENEIENNYWIVSECDKDLIFKEDNERKWQLALNKLGIEDANFASSSGHA